MARPAGAQYRRIDVDVTALAGLGRFFAGKFRAGLAYALYQRTGQSARLAEAVEFARSARDAFARVVDAVTGVYRTDLTFGIRDSEHGGWADRLPAIDRDLVELRRELAEAGDDRTATPGPVPPRSVRPALHHTAPGHFTPGADLPLTVTLEPGGFTGTVTLKYRHANQAETFREAKMASQPDGTHAAVIPADYTDSPYPLVYLFVPADPAGDAWLSPGFDETLSNQPYHAVRGRRDA